MIITRTPFRVSFAGGGTDLNDFYVRNGHGMVLSATVRKYMYIVIHPYFHDKIRIKYSQVEDVCHVDEVRHPIVRECLRRAGVDKGIEIASFADVAAGTGLGSSSAFAVGLLHALYAYGGKTVSREQLAREACEIEIDILGEPIGKQDQYAAAFGGLNVIRFDRDGSVTVAPVQCPLETKSFLESHLRLYYVGGQHEAGTILKEQRENMRHDEHKFSNLRAMMALVPELAADLRARAGAGLGAILHRGWLLKRELAGGITSAAIDDIYDRAMTLGAWGGKLLGAGGAGFLLLAHPDQDLLAAKLGCRSMPFELDTEGSTLLTLK